MPISCPSRGENNKKASYLSGYQKVVSYWKALGFAKGALVETSNTIGEADLVPGVLQIHRAQEEILRKNPSICLGSSLDYDHYLPDEGTYEGKDARWRDLWGNLPYEEAYTRARLLTDTKESNLTHLNSTALSVIGRQTAESLALLVGKQQEEKR